MADQAQSNLTPTQQAAIIGELRRQRDEALDKLLAYAAQKAQMSDVLIEAQDTITELYDQIAGLRTELAAATANQPTIIEHDLAKSNPVS